jgi:formylglycine-generating enzyme required for sulfatase activity
MAAPPKSPLDGTISINLAVPEPPPPRKPGPLEPDLPPVVAGYRRVRLLGAGGMGLVYEAVHERLGRRAALKVLRPTVAELEDFKLRFLRESKAMAAVSHPNVVSIYDAGEADGVLYMALEYVPGGDLAKRLARRGVLAVPEALDLMIQCARGLGAIHAAGLVHRDIKPQNIFVDRDGVAKIGDLGLARSASGSDRMTMTGTSWGTPAYMSPEQIRGVADLDIRSDLYALGATLYLLVCGAEAFAGPTAFVVTNQVLTSPVPDPRSRNQLVPAEVAAITRKAMAKDRAERYQTPDELLADLERARKGQRLLYTAAMPAPATPAPERRAGAAAPERHPSTHGGGLGPGGWLTQVDPLILKVIALVVVAGLLGLALWSMSEPPKGAKAMAAVAGTEDRPVWAAAVAGIEDHPAWAAASGRDKAGRWAELVVGPARARFRHCPPGAFWMGSLPDESGREATEPRHRVTLTHGFWLMETECPQVLYQEIMHANPSSFIGPNLPVDCVTWQEAVACCEALAKRVPGLATRLPTAAEWEYACRAGADGPAARPGAGVVALPVAGGAITTAEDPQARPVTVQGWVAEGALLEAWRQNPGLAGEAAARAVVSASPNALGMRAHEMGALAPNAWGFYDLNGNLLEWCADAWDGTSPYDQIDARDPEGAVGGLSECRGGAWFLPPERSRAAARAALRPTVAADYVGFRVLILEAGPAKPAP